jgi:hypothetical protein
MSRNHPNDNIYSILGKLDALSPKEQPAQAAPKQIYESVEARGSIMSGVTRLEKKLSEQYAADKKAMPSTPKDNAYDRANLDRLNAQRRERKARNRVKQPVAGLPPAVSESLIDDDSTDIRELLNFNLFRDYQGFKDGDIDDPSELQEYEQLFAAWGPEADKLERQINKAAASGAVLTPEQNQLINDNWYDGSDAYDDPLRELPGIYSREIPIIRTILRQCAKVNEGIIGNAYNTLRAKNYDRLAARSDSKSVSDGEMSPGPNWAIHQPIAKQRTQKAADIRRAVADKKGFEKSGGSTDQIKDLISGMNIRANYKEDAAPVKYGVAEGSTEFNKIKTTPYKANQMLGGKDPVAFVIEVLCPDQSVVNMIQSKVGTAYQIERDDSIEGNGIGIEIISQRFEGGRTAQAAYKQILDIIKQSGGQFNDSTEVTIARQTQGVAEASPRQHPKRYQSAIDSFNRFMDEPESTPKDELQSRHDQTKKRIKTNTMAGPKGVLPETADSVKYGVFAKGGSVGSQRFRDDPLKTFDTKEKAIADARRRRSNLSPGERGYYRMGYVVKPIKGVTEGWDDMVKAGKARDAETRSGKKATATGIKHQGKYGTDYQGDSDSEDDNQHQADKGTRKRGRPAKGTPKKAAASTEKKGVGRPKKAAAPTYSGAAGLQSFFGSTAPKKSKVKGTVHKMDESRMMDESKNTFQHILNRFKHEVKKFEEGEPIEYGSDLFHALYDYYVEAGEMPYGIQKARTGMPDEWISDRLEQDLGLSGTSLSNMSAPRPGPEMDNELNELARLAGLGEATIKKADQDYDKDGRKETEKAEVIGSRRRAAGLDDEQLDEGMCESCNCKPCECNEGNAFGKAIRAAKADGVQPGEKVRVGDKDYAVREAQELSAMLRVAGINTDQIDEAIKYVTEGSMKRWLEGLAMQLDKSDFVANADEYGMTPREAAEWWNNCNGVEYSDKYSPRNGPDDNDNDHDYYNRLDSEQYDDESFDESIPVHKHVDGPFDPNWTPGDDEGETCPECDGEGCPECYGDEHRDRAHAHAQGMERESTGMAEDEQQLNLFPRNAMPVNKRIAKNLMDFYQHCYSEAVEIQDRMKRNTDRSSWLADATDELKDLSLAFKHSLEAGIERMSVMKQEGPQMYRWIIKSIKSFTEGEIDLPVMIQQELANKKKGVDEEANSPDEGYYSIKGSTMGPGEGDPGEKNMYGGPGDNRMTQPPARPAKPVMQVRESGLTLEARLAAEYESIKKVSNEGIMGRVGGAIKNAIGKKATRPVSGPGSAPNLFDVEPYKSDTKAYLKKSAKQPNGPSNVKNIFDK